MSRSIIIRIGDKGGNSIENLEWVPTPERPKQIKKDKTVSKKPKK